MIRFTLACGEGHEFEAWFGSNDDFDAQREAGLVECPSCGAKDVLKALMAPRVSSGGGTAGTPARDLAELGRKLAEFSRQVRRNAADVGDRFPEEARRIHYGETAERPIRGRATRDEARALHEEGVSIAPLPPLPEDAN